ncbi:hypothetical protein EIP86_009633 [Pleurotus ostreatoroseus]|nr:hypothetical protein EIP86_009633 [Pleurotus ostreatoroseus]
MDSTPPHNDNVAEEFSIFYSEDGAEQHAIPQDEKAIGVVWTEDEYDILSRTDKAVESSLSLVKSRLDNWSSSAPGENHAIDKLMKEFVNEDAMDCQPSNLPQISDYNVTVPFVHPKSQPQYYYEKSPVPCFPTRDYLTGIGAVVPPDSGHNSPHFPTWEALWILYGPSLVPVIESEMGHKSQEHRLSLWLQLPSIKREKGWSDKLWKAACSVDFRNTDTVRTKFPNASRQAWLAIWWARLQVGGPECEENLVVPLLQLEFVQKMPFNPLSPLELGSVCFNGFHGYQATTSAAETTAFAAAFSSDFTADQYVIEAATENVEDYITALEERMMQEQPDVSIDHVLHEMELSPDLYKWLSSNLAEDPTHSLHAEMEIFSLPALAETHDPPPSSASPQDLFIEAKSQDSADSPAASTVHQEIGPCNLRWSDVLQKPPPDALSPQALLSVNEAILNFTSRLSEDNMPHNISQAPPSRTRVIYRCPVIVDGVQCPASFLCDVVRLAHMDRHYKGRVVCPGECGKWFPRTQDMTKHVKRTAACRRWYDPKVKYLVFRLPRWMSSPVPLALLPPDDPLHVWLRRFADRLQREGRQSISQRNDQ